MLDLKFLVGTQNNFLIDKREKNAFLVTFPLEVLRFSQILILLLNPKNRISLGSALGFLFSTERAATFLNHFYQLLKEPDVTNQSHTSDIKIKNNTFKQIKNSNK